VAGGGRLTPAFRNRIRSRNSAALVAIPETHINNDQLIRPTRRRYATLSQLAGRLRGEHSRVGKEGLWRLEVQAPVEGERPARSQVNR
jgi:hypothetical protein